MENVVLGVLEAFGGSIEAQLSFHTKMDDFQLGPMQVKGNITTDLHSGTASGNIVQSLKAVGRQLVTQEPAAVNNQ
jgi:hypothetical protein